MFITLPNISIIFLAISLASFPVEAREKWLERNNRPVYLYPRRFGQEQPAVIKKLGAACPGQVCGGLSGSAITPLLAAQPECSQQDMADDIIGEHVSICPHLLNSPHFPDAAAQFDQATKDAMIQLAIEYRQVEKNTPPVCSLLHLSSCLITNILRRISLQILPLQGTPFSARRLPETRS